MSRIFVTGDTHGDHDWSKLNTKNWPTQKELTKNDYLIIAGDWGGIWPPYPWDGSWEQLMDDGTTKYMLKSYNRKSYTTLFIDGNHDVHPYYASLPVEEWCGGKIHRVSDSIIHLMRGQVYDIDGCCIFTMGGADSIDKMWRVKDISWWMEEMPSTEEYEEAVSNLDKVGFKVDYVITHCCGTDMLSHMYTHHPYADELTNFFWHLEKDMGLEYKEWYFGHHHQDTQVDDKHRCLYYDIVELGKDLREDEEAEDVKE